METLAINDWIQETFFGYRIVILTQVVMYAGGTCSVYAKMKYEFHVKAVSIDRFTFEERPVQDFPGELELAEQDYLSYRVMLIVMKAETMQILK